LESRGLWRHLGSFLRDEAGGEVVHGDGEVDQAEGEESDDGFHGEPPSLFVFICLLRFFCSFPLSGIYDGASWGKISERVPENGTGMSPAKYGGIPGTG
jgi:hypothetical protein